MAIRSKMLALTPSDGKKSLSEILGVSERWSRVLLTVTGSSAELYVGDSTLTSTNGGASVGPSPPEREFVFTCHDNPADEFYVLATNNVTLKVLAY